MQSSMRFASSGSNNGRQTVASTNKGYKMDIPLLGQGKVWQNRKFRVKDGNRVSVETMEVCLLCRYTALTIAPVDRLESRRPTTRTLTKYVELRRYNGVFNLSCSICEV